MNTEINLNIDMETTEDWTEDEASRARMRLKELELLDVVYEEMWTKCENYWKIV